MQAGRGVPAAKFDYYLLTLSWSPEFCFSHRSAPECASHPGFVLHGLWPENFDGTYPEHCSDAPLPTALETGSPYPDPRLARHEWETHGTCSGLTPQQYFETADRAFHSVELPPPLTEISGPISMEPGDVLRLFTDSNPGLQTSSLTLSCHNGFLSAVSVCVDKDLHPTSCGSNVPSCDARTVKITPP